MRRFTICIAGLAVACSLAAVAPARGATSVDIQLRIGDRYPGTDIVFHHSPDVVVVPNTRVYYVRDYGYDMYRYGSTWYYCDGVNWYRGRSYRGPFYFIHYNSLPRPVYNLPDRYRRHWRDWHPGRGYGHYKKAKHNKERRETYYDNRHDWGRDDRDRDRDRKGKHKN